MRSFKKELKTLISDLNKENKNIFFKVNNRLSASDLHKLAYRENVKEILNMLIEGQRRGENYKDIIGENLDEFCENIIENSYKTNTFERIFTIIYKITRAIVIPTLIVALLCYSVFKENLIYLFFGGEIEGVNILPFIIAYLVGGLYLYFLDLSVRKSLKGKMVRFWIRGSLIALIILNNVLEDKFENIKSLYIVDFNYYLAIFIILMIFISYHFYNYLVLRKIKREIN